MNKKKDLKRLEDLWSIIKSAHKKKSLEHLREAGISATQATVSRYQRIRDCKNSLKDNTYVYELIKSVVKKFTVSWEQYRKFLKEWVI